MPMKERQRLEEEQDKLMHEITEAQSRLLRIREQKNHLMKKRDELFDRGMVEHKKEVRELEAQRIAGNLPSDAENGDVKHDVVSGGNYSRHSDLRNSI